MLTFLQEFNFYERFLIGQRRHGWATCEQSDCPRVVDIMWLTIAQRDLFAPCGLLKICSVLRRRAGYFGAAHPWRWPKILTKNLGLILMACVKRKGSEVDSFYVNVLRRDRDTFSQNCFWLRYVSCVRQCCLIKSGPSMATVLYSQCRSRVKSMGL